MCYTCSLSLWAPFHVHSHLQLWRLAGSSSGHRYPRQWRTRARLNLLQVDDSQLTISFLNPRILVPSPWCCWMLLPRSGQGNMEGLWGWWMEMWERDLSLLQKKQAKGGWDILTLRWQWSQVQPTLCPFHFFLMAWMFYLSSRLQWTSQESGLTSHSPVCPKEGMPPRNVWTCTSVAFFLEPWAPIFSAVFISFILFLCGSFQQTF